MKTLNFFLNSVLHFRHIGVLFWTLLFASAGILLGNLASLAERQRSERGVSLDEKLPVMSSTLPRRHTELGGKRQVSRVRNRRCSASGCHCIWVTAADRWVYMAVTEGRIVLLDSCHSNRDQRVRPYVILIRGQSRAVCRGWCIFANQCFNLSKFDTNFIVELFN